MKFDRLRLVTRRARLNMTQESLAAEAKVSLRSVAAWEAGTQLPTLRMVNKLADALNVSADWLLGGDAKDAAQSRHPHPRSRSILQDMERIERLLPHGSAIWLSGCLSWIPAFESARSVNSTSPSTC